MSIPSNTIPTKISELTTDPAPSNQGWLPYVRDGVTYKVQAADIVSVSGVPTSRQVIAGTGMTGGGQLTGNVTLSIAAGGVGTTQLATTGVTAGSYGSATQTPVITVDATGRVTAATLATISLTGYVPTSRQVTAGTGLTGGGALTGDVTLAANVGSTVPLASYNSGSAGSSSELSRVDHKHPAVDLADDTEVDGLLGLDHGGTGRSIAAAAGAIVWCGADGLYTSPVGTAGQVLVSTGTTQPSWGNALTVSDQAANVVYAGPASGPLGPTGFRALVNADIPTTLTGKTLSADDNTISGIAASSFVLSNASGNLDGSAAQKAIPTGVVVGTTDTQTLTNKTLTSPAINGGTISGITDLAVADGGTGASTASGARTNLGLIIGTDVQAWDANLDQLAGLTPTDSNFVVGDGSGWVAEAGATARTSLGLGSAAVLTAGAALGVATLDAGGTVPLSQIPASIQGGVSYQGTWNASTNTPTLTSGSGTKGYYYVVSVAGSTNLDGVTTWVVGDWAIFNGSVWQKVDNTDAVTSVNGYTGTVSLTYSDVGAQPLDAELTAIAALAVTDSNFIVGNGTTWVAESGATARASLGVPATDGTSATGTWGISVTGNAATVTNGLYTTGSYADPAWLTSLAGSKITGQLTAGISGGTF